MLCFTWYIYIHDFKIYSEPLRCLKINFTMAEPKGNPFLRKICSGYVGVPVCLLGLIGNVISFIAWKRINKKRSDSSQSAGVLMMALACVDSGLLVFFLLTESIPQLWPDVMHAAHFVAFHCYVGFPLFFFFIVASIWMVICVTYNRFIAVIFPYRALQLNSLKTTSGLIVLTLFFSFAINFPHFFNFRPSFNGTKIEKTKYGSSEVAERYDFWAHCMVLVLVPWVTIFALNSAIIYKLLRKKNIGQVRKGEGKKERQTTIILLVITISFLVFLVWQCLTQCFWMLHYGLNDKDTWFNVDSAYGPARLGVVINSAINFVLYCLSGGFFRKELKKMFCHSTYVKFNNTSTTRSSVISQRYSITKDSHISQRSDMPSVNYGATSPSESNKSV